MWAVREFGVLGFAFNLGLSWGPIQACDGVRAWGLSKMMDMGLVGKPKPSRVNEGPHAPCTIHSQGPFFEVQGLLLSLLRPIFLKSILLLLLLIRRLKYYYYYYYYYY